MCVCIIHIIYVLFSYYHYTLPFDIMYSQAARARAHAPYIKNKKISTNKNRHICKCVRKRIFRVRVEHKKIIIYAIYSMDDNNFAFIL